MHVKKHEAIETNTNERYVLITNYRKKTMPYYKMHSVPSSQQNIFVVD